MWQSDSDAGSRRLGWCCKLDQTARRSGLYLSGVRWRLRTVQQLASAALEGVLSAQAKQEGLQVGGWR